MNGILSLGIALTITSLAQPLHAAQKQQRQKAMPQASVQKAKPMAGRQVMSKPMHNPGNRSVAINRGAPRGGQHGGGSKSPSIAAERGAAQRAAIQERQRGSQAAIASNAAAREKLARNQENVSRNRGRGDRSPTVAFGGRTVQNDRVENQVNIRNRGFRSPPVNVYRDWDRGHEHAWNHHRYRWDNGVWIVIDPGYNDYYDTAPGYAVSVNGGGSLVSNVQVTLDRNGYNAGPADGVLGPQTRDAIASFQSDHGLAATGDINHPTLRALGLN